YACHMSLHTNRTFLDAFAPRQSKNRSSVRCLRSWPTHSNRLRPSSSWYTIVRYECPFRQAISSIPSVHTFFHVSCIHPQITAYFTASNTLCQLVPNTRAVSCQLNRRAHSARNHWYVWVCLCFPRHQGTASTVTPHRGQSTRRRAYRKYTAIPHSGTNSNCRSGTRSYPGPFRPQPEHVARPFARARISISTDGRPPGCSTSRVLPYTNDLYFSTRL